MPNGTVRVATSSGQVWVPAADAGDGTESSDWAPVDLRLADDGAGWLRSAAAPVETLINANGNAGPGWVDLVRMVDPAGGDHVLRWRGSLPIPEADGPRAVYRGVRPDVDLVVEVTTSGVEYFLVIDRRPSTSAEATALRSVLSAIDVSASADGTTAVASGSGVEFRSGGESVARLGQARVWDADHDSGLSHPVLADWAPAPGEVPVDDAPGSFADIPTDSSTPEPTSSPAETTAGPSVGESGETILVPPSSTIESIAGDAAVVSVVPPSSFLLDDDTAYPVVIDPPYLISMNATFDTYVQNNVSNDMSASNELKIGRYTPDSVTARSYVNWSVPEFRGRKIVNAELRLTNFHSYDCNANPWQVREAALATTSARWASQPAVIGTTVWATSTETAKTGFCGAPNYYVYADVTGLVQRWASDNQLSGGMQLSANETSSNGWKKFYSSNATNAGPVLTVDYNIPPDAATDFRMSESGARDGAGIYWTRNASPTMSVVVSDPDLDNVTANALLYSGGTLVGSKAVRGVASGQRAQWSVGELGTTMLTPYSPYTLRTQVSDDYEGSIFGDFYVRYDPEAPGAPTVTSLIYPNDGAWHGDANVEGAFHVKTAATDATHFLWNVDGPPDPARPLMANVAAGGGMEQQILYTPPTQGRHTLQVVAVDRAGNQSGVVKHTFVVGKAGILLPEEGARVVSQARVAVGVGDSSLTHVSFQYRRGPASPAGSVPSDQLHLPDGSVFPGGSTWVSISSLDGSCPAAGGWTQEQADFCSGTGGYAIWDAAKSLGRGGGPVQIQAIFAASASPSTFYSGQWVSVVVDTDVDGAATATVGPGSVNLLTGDYSVGVTDVEEFGLSVGRTTSSRDPDAGYVAQKELLTDNQRKISTDTTGFTGGNASISRSTIKGRSGANVNGALVNDSLLITPTSADSFAALDDPGARPMAFGMQPRRRYRLTASSYFDSSATPLPGVTRRARMVAFYLVNGQYIEQTSSITATPAAGSTTAIDAQQWVDQILDLTVPAGATQAFIRLYNGTTGTPVYWDDVSLREVWAPLGPEWALATSVDSVGTAYDRLTFPESGLAAVDVSGGGKIWFTASGDDTSRWYAMPGAEDLTLSKFDASTWRITEIDGTVSDFRLQSGQSDWLIDTTSPPATEGQAQYVYRQVDTLSLPYRIIAPVEAGVNPAGCLNTIPAAGCEVLQFEYADFGTTAPVGQLVRSPGCATETDPNPGLQRVATGGWRHGGGTVRIQCRRSPSQGLGSTSR